MWNKPEKIGQHLLRIAVLLIILVPVILAGCTYQSGPKVFERQKNMEKTPVKNAGAVLAGALNTTLHDPGARKFWYSGWVASNIQKRRITSMFEGAVIRPHGYVVNARLAGIPYRYYKWDHYYFLHTENKGWIRLSKEQLPLDPFAGLTWWKPFLDRAVQLPDQEVLGLQCRVLQVEVSGAEWLSKSDSPLFKDLRQVVANSPGEDRLLSNAKIKMTLWIGKQDQLIYQYQTWINLPVPGAGYMDQEVFFRFYKYGDPGISIKSPQEVEQEMSADVNALNSTR